MNLVWEIVDRPGIEEFNNWNLNRLGLTDYQQRDTGVCLEIKTGQSAPDIIIWLDIFDYIL